MRMMAECQSAVGQQVLTLYKVVEDQQKLCNNIAKNAEMEKRCQHKPPRYRSGKDLRQYDGYESIHQWLEDCKDYIRHSRRQLKDIVHTHLTSKAKDWLEVTDLTYKSACRSAS